MNPMKISLLAVAVATACGTATQTLAADSIADAVKGGKAALSFRLRYEDVGIDNAADAEADAFTLKSRVNFTTADYQGFSAVLELDDVTAIGDDDYPSSGSYTAAFPADKRAVIADPEGTEVNQAFVAYKFSGTTAQYGRQRILLDNQRFIGGVGFRQNEQTYDGFTVTNTSLANTKIFLAQIDNVNRIFGEDDPTLDDTESSSQLFNINYTGFKAGALSGYSYLLDDTDLDTQNDTYGVRFAGKAGTFAYTLEVASQDAELANGASYDATYYLAEGVMPAGPVTFTLGYEVLGSDDGAYGFSTPLATLHAFQGWADQFLATPAQGIKDVYFSAGTAIAGVKLLAVYHDYTADEDNASGDDDLGDELGVMVMKAFGPYTLSAKYASYSAGDDSYSKFDTDKLWLTAEVAF